MYLQNKNSWESTTFHFSDPCQSSKNICIMCLFWDLRPHRSSIYLSDLICTIIGLAKYVLGLTKYVLGLAKYIIGLAKYVLELAKYVLELTKYVLRQVKYVLNMY